MEFSALFAPIWRRKWQIIIIAIITSILLSLYSVTIAKPSYYATIFFTIGYRDDQQPTENYDYANFYGNNASIEFARTLSAWPKDPYFIDEIYKRAGVDKDNDQSIVDKLLGNFSVSREERANLKVNIRSKNEENLKKLSQAFLSIMHERLDTYNRQVATQYSMVNESTSLYISLLTTEESWPLGAIIGLLIGILLAYFSEARQGTLSTNQQVESIFEEPLFWTHRGRNSSIAPVATIIQASTEDVLLIGNRIRWKKLWQMLKPHLSEPIIIVDNKNTAFLKRLFQNTANVQIHDTIPAKAKSICLIVCDFPEDSNSVISYDNTTTIIATEKGLSRMHELQTLAFLIDSTEQDVYTIML